MTNEETLREIRHNVYFEMTASKDCYKATIESLEKQIPKKPVNITDERWRCPVCHEQYSFVDDYFIDIGNYLYCPRCGQALDWNFEGEEDEG